ncbi:MULTISPECIES: MerR family transcriptional regulator [Novosphingobium]|uniref:MerR family transcriptional regulator n=1 Tax=Novosphingobium sp. RL4 TaxID=3109595 RepID=UPI00163D97F8|nr:MerR family transcriptional regulator [Novosphingobium sp. RL4]WRT95935.1 MerR family transcriptional regulator [Novosphingobium sp. RL4]
MRTVKQVAKASGVSVRALHHYDHIGLLKPDVGKNGYRYYGQTEMMRLQHILFYRELGLPLAEIARILDDPNFDTRAALLDLRRRVEEEIAQRRDLAQTIDRTLASLDAGKALDDYRLFYGVSAEKQVQWEAEIVARFGDVGDAAIRDAKTRMDGLSPAQLLDFKAEINAIHAGIIALIEAGGTPSSDAAHGWIGRHYRWVCRSWLPDAEAYASLGRMYADHADFRSMYDALHPRMAVFMEQAMAHYARTTLHEGVR